MAVTSTSYNNNSDYNLLYRNQEPNASAYTLNQAQQQIESNALMAAASAAATRNKKLMQTNRPRLGIDDGFFNSNDENRVLQQPLDLSHIV